MAQQASQHRHRKRHGNGHSQNKTQTSSSSYSLNRGITMITSNPKQPYHFQVSVDTSKSRLRVQAKNKLTKDAYYGEYSSDQLKKIGFHQSIKGFHNRLKLAIESTQPDELRAYYRFYQLPQNNNLHNNQNNNQNNDNKNIVNGTSTNNSNSNNNINNQYVAMILTLEESSKYDDDSVKFSMTLKQLQIKDTVKLSEKLEDVADTVHSKYNKTNQRLEFIVSQVKEKFTKEKEERQLLEERVEQLELLCKKLTKKIVDLTTEVQSSQNNASTTTESTQTHLETMELKMNEKITIMEESISKIDSTIKSQFALIETDMTDIHPKLVRLKTRKEFNTEQGYIEYITKKLENWDENKFGPLLVRVNVKNATGKAKHFIGYVGQPTKWNHTICKVQWFGLGKMQPESVDWKALEVFLPLSAYSYPDCPHAMLPKYNAKTSSEKM